MAYRLGEHLLYGELQHDGGFTTRGRLVFASENPEEPHVVLLDLMGSPDADLRNKSVRFYPKDEAPEPPPVPKDQLQCLRLDQIGATGTMTTQGWVRTFDCSIDEFVQRCSLGEPPPTEWKRRVYLEWFGTNGRVVVEVADLIVERCTVPPTKDDPEGRWVDEPNLAFPEHLKPEDEQGGLQIIEVENLREDTPRPSTPPVWRLSLPGEGGEDDTAEDDPLHDLKLLDECLESGNDVPVLEVLETHGALQPAGEVTEEGAEAALKIAAMRLAMLNVSFDICNHCSAKQAYDLLLNEMLPQTSIFLELVGTENIMHICTHDYCARCEAEVEADYAKESGEGRDED